MPTMAPEKPQDATEANTQGKGTRVSVMTTWERERNRAYREMRKNRPTCQHKRPQEVTVILDAKKKIKRTVTKNLPCGYLLDRKGKCWFCGHKTRLKKEESDE